MHDTTTCGGPRTCPICRSWLSETPHAACARLTRENAARGFRAHSREDTMTAYTPRNSYAEGLKKLRAANSTPESIFEDRYKAERLRALQAEYIQMAEWRAARPNRRVMTADELKPFEPPNPYRALEERR